MNGFLEQLRLSLVLHFRNRMALFYGYLFPVIFLVAFWVLYRHERVPIARHLGELLTIGVLGGACFGLPTTMVSERERGVWRRYRLAPVATWSVVASTVTARYVLLLTAGLLQIVLAMAIGMPAPAHVFGLWVAFTCVAFAFLGLGLVIAMMADNVPAVQALGQCIFLPMLIIGGVAVPLASLPDWAQHLSAFFPGRYAVDALQANATGTGLAQTPFSLLALLVIGAAGSVAGAMLFRWDAGERFAARAGKRWVVVAIAAWVAVGVAAESRGGVQIRRPAESVDEHSRRITAASSRDSPSGSAAATPDAAGARPSIAPRWRRRSRLRARGAPARQARNRRQLPLRPPARQQWRAVTLQQIEADINFTRLPPDDGVVTPIAPPDEDPEPELVAELDRHPESPAGVEAWPGGRSRPARAQSSVRRDRSRSLPVAHRTIRSAHRVRPAAGRPFQRPISSRSSTGSPRIPPKATTRRSTTFTHLVSGTARMNRMKCVTEPRSTRSSCSEG